MNTNCTCLTMCRDPAIETLGGKYPMPTHHANCKAYKSVKFVSLTYDGHSCVMTPQDAIDTENDGDTVYEKVEIYLTQDQFDNMKEFTGF